MKNDNPPKADPNRFATSVADAKIKDVIKGLVSVYSALPIQNDDILGKQFKNHVGNGGTKEAFCAAVNSVAQDIDQAYLKPTMNTMIKNFEKNLPDKDRALFESSKQASKGFDKSPEVSTKAPPEATQATVSQSSWQSFKGSGKPQEASPNTSSQEANTKENQPVTRKRAAAISGTSTVEGKALLEKAREVAEPLKNRPQETTTADQNPASPSQKPTISAHRQSQR